MSYQSFGFIAFVAIALLIYYTIGKKRQLWVLALANLAFYVIAGIKYLPFILITMVATFLTGKKIGSIYEKADAEIAQCKESQQKKEIRLAAKANAKRFLLTSLFISIGLLAVCKYLNFAVTNINHLLSLVNLSEISAFKIILPLGISFYTFMAISYVLDIYWKRYKAEKNFLIYAVYLSYFPHVVQGPIDRFNEFKPQIESGVSLNFETLTFGAQLALWGFFKKLVIADTLGIFVDKVLSDWKNFDGIFIIFVFIVYSIQIYTDFSGCIDIVTGVSEMFGIKLRKNFNHPYFSKTMAEFWRRWHISLQEWFKDYIYYPVSASSMMKKNKKKLKAKGWKRFEELYVSCFPILVVWLITGIWHGASWKFVIWGIFHAILLISSKVFEPTSIKITHKLKLNTDNFLWKFYQMSRTFILCCVGRIFFRADNLNVAFSLIKKMLTRVSPACLLNRELDYGLGLSDIALMCVAVLILLVVDILQEKIKIRETLAKKNIAIRWIIVFAGLFAILLFGTYGPGYDASTFIYEQF